MKNAVMLVAKTSIMLLVFGFFSSCTEQSYIDTPEVGDVYQMECLNVVPDSPIAYNLIKVKEISGDSLLVMPNCAYYHEKVYCLTALDYFNSQAAYYLTKEQVKKMYAEGKIVEVFRVYEDSCLGHDK